MFKQQNCFSAIGWLISLIACVVLFVLYQITPGPSLYSSFPSSDAPMTLSKGIPFAGIITAFFACCIIIWTFRQHNSSAYFWGLQAYIWLFSCAATYILTSDSFIMWYGLPFPGYDYWFVFPLFASMALLIGWEYLKQLFRLPEKHIYPLQRNKNYQECQQGHHHLSKLSSESQKASYPDEYEMPQASYPYSQHTPE